MSVWNEIINAYENGWGQEVEMIRASGKDGMGRGGEEVRLFI